MDEKKESFKHVSGDYPTDYSTHAKFVLFDFDKFDKWLGRLEDAHEREVREHTLEYDIDGLSDCELAEHGLVRLPVDANGMLWTGDESEYTDTDNRRHRFNGIKFVNEGWYVCCGNDYHESLASGCRHVLDKFADPHAELSDELDSLIARVVRGDEFTPNEFCIISKRLREMGKHERQDSCL